MAVDRIQLDTLRLRLIKIGARLRELPGSLRLHLASSHPGQPLWDAIVTLQFLDVLTVVEHFASGGTDET